MPQVVKKQFVSRSGEWVEVATGGGGLDEATADAKYAPIVAAVPTGVILPFGAGAVGAVPDGWLLCDGVAVSRTTYSGLFETIGVVHGAGDGSTTFNVPNLADRVPVGWGGTLGVAGSTGGEKTHTLTTAEMPSHSHEGAAQALMDNGLVSTGNYWKMDQSGYSSWTASPGGRATSPTGGGAAHPILQPYITLLYIIKT